MSSVWGQVEEKEYSALKSSRLCPLWMRNNVPSREVGLELELLLAHRTS